MRFLPIFAGLLLLGLAAQAQDFVPGIADLPLMPGLEPVESSPVVFDKPTGRIVEVSAQGGKPEAVAAFYRAALPELGWIATPDGGYNVLRYSRDAESLRIEIGHDGTVRFLLSPQ